MSLDLCIFLQFQEWTDEEDYLKETEKKWSEQFGEKPDDIML